MKGLVFLCALLAVVHGREIRYDGYKVVRVIPENEKQVRILASALIETRKDEIDCWRFPRGVGDPVDISLSPAVYDRFYSALRSLGLKPKLTIPDVQALIDTTDALNTEQLSQQTSEDDFNYGAYHKLDEIQQWMRNMEATYPDMAVLLNITTSYEGRQIYALRISSNMKTEKPKFWIEGGIHAREWIAHATVLYMAGQMLSQYKTNENITKMVDAFDWYIVPVFNVDGYVYTWETDRNWRKTRSKSKNSKCYGTDPNRNWDDHWCVSGASKNPCSDQYCGEKAFSEPEVFGVSEYIKFLRPVKGFIDFHSYSQLWMSPWGWTKKLPADYKAQDEGSKMAVQALESLYGTKYEHGSIANIIYEASGSSADWTYDCANVTYSYGVELRDTGKHGFILPADQIIPSGQETLLALGALADYVAKQK